MTDNSDRDDITSKCRVTMTDSSDKYKMMI